MEATNTASVAATHSAPLPLAPSSLAADTHLCIRCSHHTTTCCQWAEVYCTPGDVRRIEQHTGETDFAHFAPPKDPVYLAFDDDPAWEHFVFREDGSRRILKKKPNGDCTFLGSAGCTLPLEVRPLICRIYPYDFNESGLKPTLSHGCPLELLRPGLTLLDELGMNDSADPRHWREQLYQEIREEPHAREQTETTHADRPDLRPA